MVEERKIRPSKEFHAILDYIRAKGIHDGRRISITEITKIVAKKIDKEKLWQDEFNE